MSTSSSLVTNTNSVSNSTVTVHAYEWQTKDDKTFAGRTEIRAWCLDRDSNSVLLRFPDFPIFCHIELPLYVNKRLFNWNADSALTVFKYLTFCMGNNAPIQEKGFIFKRVNKLYYYRQGRTTPMMLIKFNTQEGVKNLENLLAKPRDIRGIGLAKYSVWEGDISSIRKLLTIRQCRYSQWFETEIQPVPPGFAVSTLQREYLVDWAKMNPISFEISRTWATYPGIIVFDIESYSDNHRAMPVSTNAKHIAYMISCIYQKAGKKETRKKYLIIYGDCNPVPGSDILFVNSEIDLCEKFADIISECDPEIIIGYNIFLFDYPYLNHRLMRKGIEWSDRMTRIKGEKPNILNARWKSSGYGYNNNVILQMAGRISIDMLLVAKRDYKLPRYNLDTVANNFLGRGKHDISAQEMFKIYEELEIATALYLRIVKKWSLDKNKIEDSASSSSDNRGKELISGANSLTPTFHENVAPELIEQIIERYKKARDDMTRVAKYCIEDSELVIDLFDKIHCWFGSVELSSVLGVSIMDVFTKGQQVRGLSQVYNLAAMSNTIIDRCPSFIKGDWVGGFVMEPIPGIYDLVLCFDFKSLYPSIMRTFNICYTTLLPPELMDVIPDEMCHVIEWDEEDEDEDENEEENETTNGVSITNNGRVAITRTPTLTIISADTTLGNDNNNEEETQLIEQPKPVKPKKHYKYKFVKQETLVGILPQLADNLVNERNAVRAEMKKVEGVAKVVLDKRQLALKMSANSLFGMLGVKVDEKGKGGKIPLIEGARSICAKGRECVKTMAKYLKDKYNANVVYGDSVTGDTPILVRMKDGNIKWIEIKNLYPGLHTYADKIENIDKKYQLKIREEITDIEIWSDKGWSKIKYIMAHKTNKCIYRVLTNTGVVDVTEDHSLLDPEGRKVQPFEVKFGFQLLHNNLPEITIDEFIDIPNEGKSFKNKIEAAKYCHYLQIHNFDYDIREEDGVYEITTMIYKEENYKNEVIEVQKMGPRGGYVYDIETENHHFSAGIGRLVVHNTDSVFVQIPEIKSTEEVIPWGKRLQEEISDQFPGYLEVEFEKCGRMLSIAPKKYEFWQIDMKKEIKKNVPNPNYGSLMPIDDDDAIIDRGTTLARRDNCKWQRYTVRSVFRNALMRKPLRETLDIIMKQAMALYMEEIEWQDLVMIKGLGADYKSDSYFMKVFGDELRKAGKPAAPGDRLDYVVVVSEKPEDNKLLGKKMRLPEMYLERLDTEKPEKIDAIYYLNNVLMNCVEQAFQIGYTSELEQISKQNKEESNMRILNELRERGFGQYVEYSMDQLHDTTKAIEFLLNSNIKNRVIEARRKHVSGRDVFDTRISKTPIKTLIKSIEKGRLDEALRSLCTSELYNEIQEKMKNKEKE